MSHDDTKRESSDARVLIVSPDADKARAMAQALRRQLSPAPSVAFAPTPRIAQNLYFDAPYGVVLVHSRGPLEPSRALLAGLQLIDPQVVNVVLREQLSDRAMDELMDMGAWEVVDGTLSARALGYAVQRALARREIGLRVARLKKSHDDDLSSRTRDVLTALDASIFGLAKLVEYRDANTAFHLERLSDFAGILATRLGRLDKYTGVVNAGYVNHIRRSASLHDIGKVGIPDRILMKPGRLDDEEFGIIRYHPLIGYEAIKEIQEKLGSERFFQMAMFIAKYHHERWDGGGYPEGLKGETIPLSARIVAVTDVYDAITSERPYKPAIPHEEAVGYIREASGAHFDPDVVRAFLDAEPEILGAVQQWGRKRRSTEDNVKDVLRTVRHLTPSAGMSPIRHLDPKPAQRVPEAGPMTRPLSHQGGPAAEAPDVGPEPDGAAES